VGLWEQRWFCRYHRVFSRASWSSRRAGRNLIAAVPPARSLPDAALSDQCWSQVLSGYRALVFIQPDTPQCWSRDPSAPPESRSCPRSSLSEASHRSPPSATRRSEHPPQARLPRPTILLQAMIVPWPELRFVAAPSFQESLILRLDFFPDCSPYSFLRLQFYVASGRSPERAASLKRAAPLPTRRSNASRWR
jgi:hypothetical protein